MVQLIPAVFWPLIGGAVYVHLPTKRWSDYAQTLWANSLWASPGLINFWSCSTEFPLFPAGLWLVGQLPCIWRQTADQIGFKFHVPTHYEPPQAWLTFGHAPLNFPPFPGFWYSEQFPRICRQTADQIGPEVGGPTHYGPPLAWSTFGHAPLNFQFFLASDWSGSFWAFADKLLIESGRKWLANSLWASLPRHDLD